LQLSSASTEHRFRFTVVPSEGIACPANLRIEASTLEMAVDQYFDYLFATHLFVDKVNLLLDINIDIL
jgi:hypothetical protein